MIMTDIQKLIKVNEEIQQLSITFPLREPAIRAAIEALTLLPGSIGLDAGCGIGLQTLLLAEAVGDAGRVTGLDISSQNLQHAREIANRADLAERVKFKAGDIRDLPFENNSFDWAWSSDCVGYASMEPLPLIKELQRVVKPGGIIAILAWSSEKLLPGYPVLEARLQATVPGLAPFVPGKTPKLHFLRLLGIMSDAGLENPTVKTLVGEIYSPLREADRAALVSLFEMRWPGVEKELAPEDLAEFNRLCKIDSPDFIVDEPDYYAFFTYSMFIGRISVNS